MLKNNQTLSVLFGVSLVINIAYGIIKMRDYYQNKQNETRKCPCQKG